MKYRKKPVVIEAMKFGYDNFTDWFSSAVTNNDVILHIDIIDGQPFERANSGYCIIKTLEGQMKCDWGDFVIKGINEELYPCKPDVFKKTYEKVED